MVYNYYAKAGIILGGWIFGGFLLAGLLNWAFAGASEGAKDFVTMLITAGFIYFLTRIFRTPGETAAPRPWWQMTGKPTAAFGISLFFLVGLILPLIIVGMMLISGESFANFRFHPWGVASTLIQTLLGCLYYATWWKLRKHNPRVVVQENEVKK